MKKILLLAILFVFFIQPVQAKGYWAYNAWQKDSRHWWERTVKVNPDRAGAMFIHDYTDEWHNIYDSFECVFRILFENWYHRPGLAYDREEYLKYASNMFAYEYGDVYFREAKYQEKIAQIAKDLGEDYEWLLSYAKRAFETKGNFAWLNLKDISEDKIIVLPQTIDNREWIIGDVLINQNSFVFEYLPKDNAPTDKPKDKEVVGMKRIYKELIKELEGRNQMVQLYSKTNEVFSIEFVKKEFAKDLEEYKYKFQMYNKLYKDDLELKYEEKELSKSDNGFTWYYGFGDKNENVVMAVKQVEDGYFRVAYLKYNSMSKEEIDKCQSIVEERIKTLK